MHVIDDGVDHAYFRALDALQFALCPFHGYEDAAMREQISRCNEVKADVYLRVHIAVYIGEETGNLF